MEQPDEPLIRFLPYAGQEGPGAPLALPGPSQEGAEQGEVEAEDASLALVSAEEASTGEDGHAPPTDWAPVPKRRRLLEGRPSGLGDAEDEDEVMPPHGLVG